MTIIDTGTVVAAPFACELAAEAGAQVIRVSLPDPDILELSPFRLQDGDESVSTWWAQENRNKLDMVLDLTRPESKEILGGLLAKADIWIESSRPGTYAEHLGLTDEWALSVNPRLVVVHVSGFGQDGDPDTYRRASYDVIGQAFSGSMSMNGEPDGPPMKSNPFANDYVTALFALWSALAAYISVQRTGRGQVVDVAQYECQFKLLACGLMDYLMLGQEHPRTGNSDPSGAAAVWHLPHPRGLHQHRRDRRPVPPAEGRRARPRPGQAPDRRRPDRPRRRDQAARRGLAGRAARRTRPSGSSMPTTSPAARS